MHLLFINLGELLIPLWRGTLPCETTDDKISWDWMTLVGKTWLEHGKLVAAATKYFPSSFHRPPRNPTEKISSGYKAIEYFLYLFGLGPALFRTVLPHKYWQHFCKLVHGVRIITQRRITVTQVREAYCYLTQFVEEYENLYYQRRMDRLHFCRPCLHTLLHAASEVPRVGPGAYLTQFTMERAIGDLGGDIKQPSNIYGNLCQIALRQSQLNALKALYPEFDPDTNKRHPAYSEDIGHGYLFLRRRDRRLVQIPGIGGGIIVDKVGRSDIRRWGRLQLPNGQVARSVYKENRSTRENQRVSRNVKIRLNDIVQYAEIQFYFFLRDEETTEISAYALASIYGPPNADLLAQSSHTLCACQYLGDDNLQVIPITSILTVVSMQRLPIKPGEVELNDLWFVTEKSGIDDSELTGYVDEVD